MRTTTPSDSDGGDRADGAALDDGWSSQRVLQMEEAPSDVRRLERRLSDRRRAGDSGTNDEGQRNTTTGKEATTHDAAATAAHRDRDRDATPPRRNSALAEGSSHHSSMDSLTVTGDDESWNGDDEAAGRRGGGGNVLALSRQTDGDDSVSTLGASTHLSVELEHRLADEAEVEVEVDDGRKHKRRHTQQEEEGGDRPPSLSVEDMAATLGRGGSGSKSSSRFYDSGLVTEVHRNNARLRRGSELRLSLSTEEEVDEEEDGEEIDNDRHRQHHHHVSMTLADLAHRSFASKGASDDAKPPHNNSTSTVDELQAAAGGGTGAGLSIPTGAANSASAMGIGASSSSTSSSSEEEEEDPNISEIGASDIGLSNSTRETMDTREPAHRGGGGGLLPVARSTRSSITDAGYATGLSSITGTAGSNSLYPTLGASPHVPGWTPPDHDFVVPLTDGRKRPKKIRARSNSLLKNHGRRNSGEGIVHVGAGTAAAAAGGRHRSSTGTGTGARAAAKGRGRKSAGTLAREASTGNVQSVGSDETPKTTQRKQEEEMAHVPEPTSLHRFQSDTTAETFGSLDQRQRPSAHTRHRGHQFQGSHASLDPADLFDADAARQPKGADTTPRSSKKRMAKGGRRMASSSDHVEVDDYSFAPSLEPDSREPSLYNGSSHYPQDDGYLVPLKGNTSPAPGDQQPRRWRQLDRSQRSRRSTRTTRRSRSNSFSSASIGSFVNDMLDRAASAIGGGGGGEDMTRSGEVTTEEAGGLLDNVDAEDDDGSAEYIDLQDNDDDNYSQDNSWVPSVVDHPAHSSGVSLDDTTHSRLTMDEGLYAALGNSGSVTHEQNSRRQSTRRAGRKPQPTIPVGFSSRSRSRSNESRGSNADGQSYDGSRVSFHDSVGSESLLDEDELARGHGGRSRSGSRGSHRSRGRQRRPSIDMIDEIAKKVGERIMRQQRRGDRSLGDYSISHGGIPDLHDDDDSYDNQIRIGGFKYGYDDRKDSFQFSRSGRSGRSGFLYCNKRITLLLAAAAAIAVALVVGFGGNSGGGIPIGPGNIVHQVNDDEPLAPDVSRALEDELKRRAKQIQDLNTAHSETGRDDNDDPDEIFAGEDGEVVDISKTKKHSPVKLKPLPVLIECTRDDGCFEAMQDSVNVHVESLKDSHIVSIDIDDADFNKLRSLKHVKYIDLDFNLGGIEDVLVDESELDEEDLEEGFELLRSGKDGVVKEGPRTLAQTIPVGATMVQAVDYDGTPFPTGSSPKTICIADTGACRDHPDISSNPDHLWGTDMVVDGRTVLPWAPDRNGHGCHLTGLISALDNSVGYHGISAVSGGVKIFSTRALDDEMSGSISQMQRAIDQCVSNDADIIVLSLGCQDCYSRSLDQYFDRIANKNILIFAAAGNNGAEAYPQPFYPATYPSVISVGAVNKHRGRWYMSNRNYGVSLVV